MRAQLKGLRGFEAGSADALKSFKILLDKLGVHVKVYEEELAELQNTLKNAKSLKESEKLQEKISRRVSLIRRSKGVVNDLKSKLTL